MIRRLLNKLFTAHRRPAKVAAVRREIAPDPETRAEIGVPPTREGLDFAVDAYEPDDNWSFQIFVSEGAEFYFGTQVFKSLEGRFASIPGISRVHHMDREVFIVKTDLSREALTDAIWSCILDASCVTDQPTTSDELEEN
jgi:hypothetical protein